MYNLILLNFCRDRKRNKREKYSLLNVLDKGNFKCFITDFLVTTCKI